MLETETPNEKTVEAINDLSETSVGPKRRRKGVKLRSKAWDHFTKLIKEDGTVDKCQCNHCFKQFTCAGKTGTTHLLSHITKGACSIYNKDENETSQTQKPLSSRKRNPKPKASSVPWKYNSHRPSEQIGLSDYDYLVTESFEEEYGGESWMNELRGSVGRLAELTNTQVHKFSSIKPCSVADVVPRDYSLAAVVKCLNEMDDIPQSSEMYLDAFEVVKVEDERECFICLPPEPRRRWLQRMLVRNYPSRYNYDSQ